MNNKFKFITNKKRIFIILFLTFLLSNLITQDVCATEQPAPFSIDVNFGNEQEGGSVVGSLQILFIVTIIALAPSILIMMTSFTRLVVVLHFLRAALGTQQTPPNQVLVGLALFLTFFIMTPVLNDVNTNALEPYSAGEITQQEAINSAMEPIRGFMFRQVNSDDLELFMDIANIEKYEQTEGVYPTSEEIPSSVLIPAFVISELRIAFIIGFLIYIPFIVIDMVVASTLMSMGMMMLPPVMISLPFKILLFVMVDGWNLFVGQLVNTFR